MRIFNYTNGVYANLRGVPLEDAISEVETLVSIPAKVRMRTKQEYYENCDWFGTKSTSIRESYTGKIISVIAKGDRYISVKYNSIVRECTSNWQNTECLLESLYVLRYYLRSIEGFR